jgi:hypothetical protein
MKEREQQFLHLYYAYRVADIGYWYAHRGRESRIAQCQLGYLAAVIYLLAAGAGVCASVNLLGHRAVWAVIGAAFAVSIAALKRYGELFSYRETAQLYSDASRELLKLSEASPANNANATYAEVDEYVLGVEKALLKRSIDSAQVQNPVPRG